MAVYKGRGATGNPQPRFLKPAIESVDDGWYRDEVPDSIATQVRPEAARSIITATTRRTFRSSSRSIRTGDASMVALIA